MHSNIEDRFHRKMVKLFFFTSLDRSKEKTTVISYEKDEMKRLDQIQNHVK